MRNSAPRLQESLPLAKRVLFTLATTVISFLLLELGVRVIFAFRVGPAVLLHGLRPAQETVDLSVSNPDHSVGLYAKYTPHQVRIKDGPIVWFSFGRRDPLR